MIPRTIPTWQEKNWQEELSAMITEPKALFSMLGLPQEKLAEAEQAAKLFPLKATRSYVSRISPKDLGDPLLRQILPLGVEVEKQSGYSDDPLQESHFNPAPGLIHKYRGRVLLIASPHCAIHCRYCFRRNFDYEANQPSRQDWQQAFNYIREDDSINEVILSGGDPLALSDRHLQWLFDELASIAHVDTLRIHSRLPIVLPSRVTQSLLGVLNSSSFHCVVVVHANHPQEIDTEVGEALRQLRQQGVHLLNQCVLLNGINDSADTLERLNRELFNHGVLPYYLHMLDKVNGTRHFDVTQQQAKALHAELVQRLPGYLVPKLVREIPGENAKSAVL